VTRFPIADAGADRTVVLENDTVAVALDGTASTHEAPGTPLYGYYWTGNFVGGVAYGPTPTVRFTSGGHHFVRLQVSDGSETDDDEVRISVATNQSQTKNPSAAINGGSFEGSFAWTNPRGVLSRGNGAAITEVDVPYGLSLTQYLEATGFGFDLPADAAITGVKVTIRRHAKYAYGVPAEYVFDHHVYLLKNGANIGSDRRKTGAWPTSYANASYGSASDKWGRTWTPAEVNATGFGVGLQVEARASLLFPSIHVDHITMTVSYTATP
jgi:hypothetical protein